MNKFIKIGLFGFLIWILPFMVSFLIFGFHEDYRPLFESIMAVTVTLVIVIFSILYFTKPDKGYLKEGIIIGIIWMMICLFIDLIIMVLLESPMQMPIGDYMMDIGVTYLIIPVITIGFVIILKKR